MKQALPQVSWADIHQAILAANRILVVSHQRPDADALGSTLAMAIWLHSLGKSVQAWNEDGMTDKFSYLPDSALIRKPPAQPEEFDLVIALDNAVKARLGSVVPAIGGNPQWINIDHHISNEGYGNLNCVDATKPATGQILAEFFLDRKIPINSAMAANLYAAISTDTGSFQYPNTTAETLEVAAQLVRAGVNIGELSQQIYESFPKRRFHLLQHALASTEFSCEGRVASFSLSKEDVLRLEVLPDDNEGIIDHIRAVDCVVAAVFFEELPEGKVRVSSRSKNSRIDVCEICRKFGGGGHALAAGARIAGTLDEVREKFLTALCHEIRKLD